MLYKNHFDALVVNAWSRFDSANSVTIELFSPVLWIAWDVNTQEYILSYRKKTQDLLDRVVSFTTETKWEQAVIELCRKASKSISSMHLTDSISETEWLNDLILELREIASDMYHSWTKKHIHWNYYDREFQIHYSEVNKLIESLNAIISLLKRPIYRLFFNPTCLLLWEWWIGKTHSLVQYTHDRLDAWLDTICLLWSTISDDAWLEWSILNSISDDLALTNLTELLELLDSNWISNWSRSLIIIDALNEKVWYDRNTELESLVEKISKYPNLWLMVSIRNWYEHILDADTSRLFNKVELEWLSPDEMFTYLVNTKWMHLLEYWYLEEFRNPLYLQQIIKFINSPRSRGKKWLNRLKDIFSESYIEDYLSWPISLEFTWSDTHKQWVWKLVKNIVQLMINTSSMHLKHDDLVAICTKKILKIQKNYTKFQWLSPKKLKIQAEELIQILQNNWLLLKYWDGVDALYQFTYNKFFDYLASRVILMNMKKSKQPWKYLKKIIENLSYHTWIIEWLFVWLPEFYKIKELQKYSEIILNTYWEDTYDLHHRSFIYLDRDKLPNKKKTREHILKRLQSIQPKFYDFESGHKISLIDTILKCGLVRDHPLNANFLVDALHSLWNNKFDYIRTQKISLMYTDGSETIANLINLAHYQEIVDNLDDEIISLFCKMFMLMTSSTNSWLRHKVSDCLIRLLHTRRHLIVDIIEQFKDTNDCYILESLYAVVYWISVLWIEQNLVRSVELLYERLFIEEAPIMHAGIREYMLQSIIMLEKHWVKISYKNGRIVHSQKQYAKKLKTKLNDEKIKKISDKYVWIWRIQQSLLWLVSDFWKYVVWSDISHRSSIALWSKKMPDRDDELDEDIAKKRILEHILWVQKYKDRLHWTFDSNVPQWRWKGDIRRIWKKYQRIAHNALLAFLADNFKYRGDRWDREIKEFTSNYEISHRRYDPTNVYWIMKNNDVLVSLKNIAEIYSQPYNEENTANYELVPDMKEAINPWEYITLWWISNFESTKNEEWSYIEVYIQHKCYLWDMQDSDNLLEWVKTQDHKYKYMPDRASSESMYLWEIVEWSIWYQEFYDWYWKISHEREWKEPPCDLSHLLIQIISINKPDEWDMRDLDHSLLIPEIADEMGLVFDYSTWSYIDSAWKCITYTITDWYRSQIFIQKDFLVRYLSKHNKFIFFVPYSEKVHKSHKDDVSKERFTVRWYAYINWDWLEDYQFRLWDR